MTAPAATGRCYCGRTSIVSSAAPLTVAYCHCSDCRRSTGAPVAAFAAFEENAVTFSPDDGTRISLAPGVTRSFCPSCGSPLSGRYDYLPGQVYVPIGLLDQADALPPRMHAHDGERLPWLCIADDLPTSSASARERLNEADD